VLTTQQNLPRMAMQMLSRTTGGFAVDDRLPYTSDNLTLLTITFVLES